MLKLFQTSGPAEAIALDTIQALTFGLVQDKIAIVALGCLECAIGFELLWDKLARVAIPLLYFQMACTLLPLAIFTDKTWKAWFVPTMMGQYILKNIVIISCAIVLGAVNRGGRLVTDPVVAQRAKKKEAEKMSSGRTE